MARDKDAKLKEKVDLLLEKSLSETNPISRGIIAAKLTWLSAKMQKEIDVQTIREQAANEREEIQQNLEEKQKDGTISKTSIALELKKIEKELKEAENFDPYSPNFLYEKELERNNGDAWQLISYLESLETEETNEVAESIRDAMYLRDAYDEKQMSLEEIENNSEENVLVAEAEHKENIKAEKSLVRQEKKKANIFKRIFQAIKSGFKERRRTMDNRAGLQTALQEQSTNVTDEQEEKIEEIKREYDAEIDELKLKIAELEKQRDTEVESYKSTNVNKDKRKANDIRMAFRESLQNFEVAENAANISEEFAQMKGIEEESKIETDLQEEKEKNSDEQINENASNEKEQNQEEVNIDLFFDMEKEKKDDEERKRKMYEDLSKISFKSESNNEGLENTSNDEER